MSEMERENVSMSQQVPAVFVSEKGVCEKPAVQQQVIISLSTQTERYSKAHTHTHTRVQQEQWSDNRSGMEFKQAHC